MPAYHLAQINIARLLAPLDSAQLVDFVNNLEPINTLADQSPGFVWRLKTEEGDATSIQAFDDSMIIVNMSVWESVEALKNFAYASQHALIMKRRREWFDRFPSAYMVLWWIERGHIPTPLEARQRLDSLDQHGPTAFAFTFRNLFDSPDSDPVG